jgi:hypothetical protein
MPRGWQRPSQGLPKPSRLHPDHDRKRRGEFKAWEPLGRLLCPEWHDWADRILAERSQRAKPRPSEEGTPTANDDRPDAADNVAHDASHQPDHAPSEREHGSEEGSTDPPTSQDGCAAVPPDEQPPAGRAQPLSDERPATRSPSLSNHGTFPAQDVHTAAMMYHAPQPPRASPWEHINQPDSPACPEHAQERAEVCATCDPASSPTTLRSDFMCHECWLKFTLWRDEQSTTQQ